MISLPGFIWCLVLLRTSFGVISPSAEEQSYTCPGICTEETECVTALNETDCANDLVCCLDNLDEMATTQFADFDFTTEDAEEADSTPLVEEEEDETEGYQYLETDSYETNSDETDQDFRYVYSDGSEEFELDSLERSGDVSDTCPGVCVLSQYTDGCEYVISSDVCPTGSTCCLTEHDVQKTSHSYDYEEVGAEDEDVESEDQNRVMSKRESEASNVDNSCPGDCVHPSHAMFCDKILPQFPCPLNSKCCIKRSVERALPETSIFKCTGQCLPLNMHGYCFPPNELILGSTTCPRGTACCMRRPLGNVMQPPSVNRMQFPSLTQSSPNFDPSRVLGHLAVDDMGTVYKVSTNGRVSPIPRISPIDHGRTKFTKLTTYPRFDGEIVIYSDGIGHIFQQFYPRRLASFPQAYPQRPDTPLVRQPIYQFESQVSQHATTFQESAEMNEDVPDDEVVEDIVIPDDDDEAPVPTTSTPVVHDKSSSPACPGSCMSYFLRFTCFRGYAIYDGFTCSGRSVCCARLKDIEDHEEYLKSLSPYFNAPPVSRDSNVPRCGLKGRRDTPRVIGGKESLPGEWCWQVAIINVQNQYICGGALIDNSWVLTAAHCVVGPMKENQALFVRVGVTDLKSSEDNNKGQTVRVLSTFVHHNFNNVNLDNNIALLRLQKSIDLGPNVCVICLPTSGQMPMENTRCTVTGYGFVSADDEMSLKIREARVPVIDDMDCMANVTEALGNAFIIPSSSFCAGGRGQQDACQGDAGGPLACEVGGFHELVGLVSWGLGCGRSDVPSIYVKVPSFMGWINQIISSSSFLMSLN